VDRSTNCSNNRQGLRRSKGVHRPKRNPKRGQVKKHTECFSCSRIYFDRLLPTCPHCGSAVVRHYNSEELNCFSHGSSADECVEFERRANSFSKGGVSCWFCLNCEHKGARAN
jgi:hypothetical protein